MRKIIVATTLVVGLVACGGGQATTATTATTANVPAANLEGRVFEVTLDEPGAPAQPDTLSFKGGKFESSACIGFGFKATDYSSKAESDGSAFQVSTVHPADGTKMDWKGTVHGDQIEGIGTRTMNGKTTTLKFKGAAKK